MRFEKKLLKSVSSEKEDTRERNSSEQLIYLLHIIFSQEIRIFILDDLQ